MTTQTESIADDILRGCAAIARFVGLNERDCFFKLERGYLPANKEGSIWVSTKSRLRQHYSEARYTPPPQSDDSEPDAAPPPPPRRRPTPRPRSVTRRPNQPPARQQSARRGA